MNYAIASGEAAPQSASSTVPREREQVVSRILAIEKAAGITLGTWWVTGMTFEEWARLIHEGRERMAAKRLADAVRALGERVIEAHSQPMRTR